MLRRRRDEHRWQHWQSMSPYFGVGPVKKQPTGIVLEQVRQRASTGLKGYVRFPSNGTISAVWFPNWWPSSGDHIVVTGHFWTDRELTHHGEVVFWVDAVHAVAGRPVFAGWRRHQRRLDRRARRRARRAAP